MNNIEIYFFKENHVDEITTINNLCFPISWSKDSMKKELENKFAKYVVAVKDNVVIGYGGFWIILDEGHITNIAVHPEYRRIGAGQLMLSKLINISKELSLCAMTLEVRKSNIPAQNLYKKFGFIEEGIRKKYYADNNEDAIIMWKRDI